MHILCQKNKYRLAVFAFILVLVNQVYLHASIVHMIDDSDKPNDYVSRNTKQTPMNRFTFQLNYEDINRRLFQAHKPTTRHMSSQQQCNIYTNVSNVRLNFGHDNIFYPLTMPLHDNKSFDFECIESRLSQLVNITIGTFTTSRKRYVN